MSSARATSIVLTVVAAALWAACSRPPGSGSIDGMDIGLRTELHLKDLARLERPGAESLAFARRLVTHPPAMLDSLREYSAVADMEEEGKVPVRIRVLPLASSEGGGILALVIDPDGDVLRSRVWGNETSGNDPDGAWGLFWEQFEDDGTRSLIDPGKAIRADSAMSYRDSLEADTSAAAALTRLMYEHRLIMMENSYFLTRSAAVSGGNRVPPLDWIEGFRGTYRRMAEMAEELRPVIGDSASMKYAAVVDDGSDVLALVAESAAAEQGDAVREQSLTFRRRTCGACHGIENHTAGAGKLKGALSGRLEEFGVRRDLFVTGLDVWAVPDDVAGSQAMADAIKAVLAVAESR